MTTILIIEDNPVNLDLLSRRLSRDGFRILASETAWGGIELAHRHQPDLIIMDLGLPEFDGLSATRKLRSDSETSAIPVVALTAHAFESDRRAALNAGCCAFHSKPVEYKRLKATIAGILSGSDQVECA